ncbi:MAG: hypothetical protein ACYC35_25775 [Pirellulales bacterium]
MKRRANKHVFRVLALLATFTLLAALPTCASAAGRIELELATEPGFPGIDAQKWYQLLTKLGVSSLRIRPLEPRDRVGIVTAGSTAQPVYTVTGMLTEQGELVLPGGRFTERDRAGLAKWLADLAAKGPPRADGKTLPYGLGDRQSADVLKDLMRPVDFSTAGVPRAKAVAELGRRLGLPLAVAPGVTQVLQGADPVAEELRGLARGTALAYLLRPAGMAFAPRSAAGGAVEYVVAPAGELKESWAIGRVPEKQPLKVLPEFFEMINVEIEAQPLSDVLESIRSRLKAPILLDYYALSRQEIDPAKVKVALPAKRMSYSLIMPRLLAQARLKGQLRIDEAGKPFYWITTVRTLPPGAMQRR